MAANRALIAALLAVLFSGCAASRPYQAPRGPVWAYTVEIEPGVRLITYGRTPLFCEILRQADELEALPTGPRIPPPPPPPTSGRERSDRLAKVRVPSVALSTCGEAVVEAGADWWVISLPTWPGWGGGWSDEAKCQEGRRRESWGNPALSPCAPIAVRFR